MGQWNSAVTCSCIGLGSSYARHRRCAVFLLHYFVRWLTASNIIILLQAHPFILFSHSHDLFVVSAQSTNAQAHQRMVEQCSLQCIYVGSNLYGRCPLMSATSTYNTLSLFIMLNSFTPELESLMLHVLRTNLGSIQMYISFRYVFIDAVMFLESVAVVFSLCVYASTMCVPSEWTRDKTKYLELWGTDAVSLCAYFENSFLISGLINTRAYF